MQNTGDKNMSDLHLRINAKNGKINNLLHKSLLRTAPICVPPTA